MDIPAAVKRTKLLESGIATNELTIIRMAHRVLMARFGNSPLVNMRRMNKKLKALQAETAVMRIEKLHLFWKLIDSGKIKMKWNVK